MDVIKHKIFYNYMNFKPSGRKLNTAIVFFFTPLAEFPKLPKEK